MQQYLNLLHHVMENGEEKSDRTGTGTKSVFGHQMRFDLANSFPLLTTKKVHLKSIIYELLWFLKGETNIKYLKDNGVSIWDEWADDNGDLGPVYGKQWRKWEGLNGAHDQIKQVIEQIKSNPNSRRHTSFASVSVSPAVNEDIDIEINQKDLRVDTFRSSGAGGQHVNKTDSAIRITHIPSGIVTQCQTQRSQHKNKEQALKVLKSKLFQLEMEKQLLNKKELEGEKKDIGWGSQIRSYVFHPYNMIKDHRTKHEVGNIKSVMDGNIDDFIYSYLLDKMEKNK